MYIIRILQEPMYRLKDPRFGLMRQETMTFAQLRPVIRLEGFVIDWARTVIARRNSESQTRTRDSLFFAGTDGRQLKCILYCAAVNGW
jgi:hypothetical protein